MSENSGVCGKAGMKMQMPTNCAEYASLGVYLVKEGMSKPENRERRVKGRV